ncbi:MAG: hypothetical protein RDU20_10375 [Desulfomonilaceae bacterium]|nr:hypothetical protein [Desulfomonilaceae bacterium]
MILDFQMNNLTTVEALEKGLWRITQRSDDNLFSIEVTLDVKGPALDIRRAVLDVKRDVLGLASDLTPLSEKLVGVRVGPGMTKIVRGVIGGPDGSNRAAELVLEAMEMLVNSITVPELRKAAAMAGVPYRAEDDGPKVFVNDVVIEDDMVRKMAGNPRLKDSCAAFRDL